jgi:hypothetical protein
MVVQLVRRNGPKYGLFYPNFWWGADEELEVHHGLAVLFGSGIVW